MVVDLAQVRQRQGGMAELMNALRASAAQNHGKLLQPAQLILLLGNIQSVSDHSYQTMAENRGLASFYNFVQAVHSDIVDEYIAQITQEQQDIEDSEMDEAIITQEIQEDREIGE